MASDWLVAIPSYKRAKTIQRKTLRVLREGGVDASRVHIFVSSAEEMDEYVAEYHSEYKPNIIVGQPGIHRQREFIHQFFPEGQRLVCMDDDVTAIKTLYPGVPLPILLTEMFRIGVEQGCALIGVYPSDNGLSMKDRAVKGLVYVIGSFFLMVNWHGASYPSQTTEDFTRTLLAWKEGRGVLRFEGIAPTTRYFREPGGLQTYRTEDIQEREMKALVDAWPGLAIPRYKHGKYMDVRLKRKVDDVFNKPFQTLRPKKDDGAAAAS